jgi:hypothetical protein
LRCGFVLLGCVLRDRRSLGVGRSGLGFGGGGGGQWLGYEGGIGVLHLLGNVLVELGACTGQRVFAGLHGWTYDS